MHKKFKSDEGKTISQKFTRKKALLKPFLKKYQSPVLVHATPEYSVFKNILSEGKLKLPPKFQNKEHLHIERLIGLYPSIFFSLGFTYTASYDFKYGFIFNLDFLKETEYYKNSIAFQCYRDAFRYFESHDPELVKKLYTRNDACKKVIDTYYNKKFRGQTRLAFEFWKIESEFFELIKNHPKKSELKSIFKRIQKEKFIKYPKSVKIAIRDCLEEFAPEIISKKDVSLNGGAFLGFYINGKIPKPLKLMLKKDYSDKIFYNGKKISLIKEL